MEGNKEREGKMKSYFVTYLIDTEESETIEKYLSGNLSADENDILIKALKCFDLVGIEGITPCGKGCFDKALSQHIKKLSSIP